MKRYLIVGAGFSGAVLARHLAENLDRKIILIDKRSHIAGNCHTERDEDTGVMVHRYGAHIFHTSDLKVWKYITQFGNFYPFINRPKASIESGIYSLPINLHTINQFFSMKLNPNEAKKFLTTIADNSIKEPKNFEEQALKFIGKELYEAFFYGYTKKQWGCEPNRLPASILKRIPVRYNYNDNYYNSIYQGIPEQGYSQLIANILDHPNIQVKLNTAFDPIMRGEFSHVFYTGPLDEFYGFQFGRLSYRTVYWEKSIYKGDFQGHPGINYPELDVSWTRIREHKHYTYWEQHESTVVFKEYSKETGENDEPYYPKRLAEDKALLNEYVDKATSDRGVSFLGRLGTYRYMDMHQVIRESLDFGVEFCTAHTNRQPLPMFPEQMRR